MAPASDAPPIEPASDTPGNGEFNAFPENAERVSNDLGLIEEALELLEFSLERTVDILELPSIALKLTKTIRSIADTIETLADAVRDVPKLGAVAKVIADVLDILTDTLRTIENTLDGFVDRAEVIKTNVSKAEEIVETLKNRFGDASEANEVAFLAASVIRPVVNDQYEDVEDQGGDTDATLLACLDMLAEPYNDVVEGFL